MPTLDQGVLNPATLRKKHVVLLVDDDLSVLSSLYRCLRDEPYEVFTAESAVHALEILGRGSVSLLVADQRMPGMCGADLFEEVRRRFPATRRVMLTGYPGSARVRYGLAREEIERLIPKPWDGHSLKETIRQLLKERESAQPPAQPPEGKAVRAAGPEGPLPPRAPAEEEASTRPGDELGTGERSPETRRSSLIGPRGREILERKEAEEELQEMNLILENAEEGISRIDAHGRFLSVNKAYGDFLGISPGEFPGRDWQETFHPDDRASLAASYARMKEAGKSEREARGIRKDGTLLAVHLLLLRAQDKQGNFIGHYGFMKDISERKRALEERDRMSAQLLQGQKIQAIGQLAAGIAHEINNPVGYILSNLTTLVDYARGVSRLLRAGFEFSDRARAGKDFLREAKEFERLRAEVDADFLAGDFEDALVQSRQGAERIRDIVRSLKDFAHADQGELESVDLKECLEGALRLCWNEIKYKASVERDYSDTPPVRATALGLEQVFMTLLVNAAQAIEKKGVIRVSLGPEGNEAVVRFRDTGSGISEENQKRLFEPFFTTKPVGKGTGLGLHVAYKIVGAHRGRIEVASEVGRGTEFSVRLPLAGPGPGGVP